MALPTAHTTWMNDDLELIRHLPLSSLAIPGSHNSASYAIESNCKQVAGDCPRTLCKLLRLPLVSTVVSRWVKCQRLSVYEQLLGGIRYLCHGLRSITLEAFVNQIIEFITRFPSELVIVDVNHVYVDSKFVTRAPNDLEHHYILDRLLTLLDGHVVPRDYHPGSTFESLVQGRQRVILIYDHDHIAISKGIWDRNTIYSHWPNSSRMKRIETVGIRHILLRNPDKLHVMQMLFTLSDRQIMARMACSIMKHSRRLCESAPDFILEQCMSDSSVLEHFNIVIIDDCGYNDYAIVTAVRQINKCKASRLQTLSS